MNQQLTANSSALKKKNGICAFTKTNRIFKVLCLSNFSVFVNFIVIYVMYTPYSMVLQIIRADILRVA